MELELRKMNKINKSKKQNNYTSNVNPLDIIKGEKEVQVLKMELISELEEYYLQINKNKKKILYIYYIFTINFIHIVLLILLNIFFLVQYLFFFYLSFLTFYQYYLVNTYLLF